MADLSEIRAGIKTTLEARIDGIVVYHTIPEQIIPPAIIVIPTGGGWERGMGPGVDDLITFDLTVLTSAAISEQGQDTLDAYLSSAGPRSIREAFHAGGAFHTLGLVNTKAWVTGWGSYQPPGTAGGLDYVSASVRLSVLTSAMR